MNSISYALYLVTDDPSRYAGDWLENVAAAVAGGVTCVQYRDTESSGPERYLRARALKDLLAARRVPLVVNNDAALALAVGAEGVHVGQGDLPPEAVRAAAGTRLQIGYSITSIVQLANFRVRKPAFDAVGAGPVFDATKTKSDAAAPMGLAGLRAIVETLDGFPSVAIGGLNLENATDVYATGVGGLALVSAFSRAADPEAVARALLRCRASTV